MCKCVLRDLECFSNLVPLNATTTSFCYPRLLQSYPLPLPLIIITLHANANHCFDTFRVLSVARYFSVLIAFQVYVSCLANTFYSLDECPSATATRTKCLQLRPINKSYLTGVITQDILSHFLILSVMFFIFFLSWK